MNYMILYYLLLALTMGSGIAVVVIWIRDLLIQRRRRRLRRQIFYTNPFLAHWRHDEKPRENRRV